MATGLLETGPKLDWTRDNKIFDRYQIWKEKVELIFSNLLLKKVLLNRKFLILDIGWVNKEYHW